MSIEFSQSSRLIVRNWDIVKEIHKAEEELTAHLRMLLFAFEPRFQLCKWWGDEWCLRRDDAQIYVSHSTWKRGDEYAIWIGMENFTVEALFGTDNFASLYVWVSGQRPQLVSALRRSLDEEADIIGDVQTKGNSAYVVTNPLRKCLPEEMDKFDDVVGTPVLDFFSFYAGRAKEFTRILDEMKTAEVQQPSERDK